MFNHITLPLSFSFPLSLQKPIPSFFQNHPHPHPNYPHLNFTLPLPKKKKKRKRIPTYLHYTIQMEHTKMEMGLVLVVMAMLCAGAVAQSSCTNVLVSLSPCLNYITGNSSTPSSGCCSQLASVVRSQPQCLCQVLSGGGSSLGLNINQTQALALPGACEVQTPPTSQCNNGKYDNKFLFHYIEYKNNKKNILPLNMCIQP